MTNEFGDVKPSMTSSYLGDAAEGFVSIGGAESHVGATQTQGRPHNSGHEEGQGPLSWLEGITLHIHHTHTHRESS